jgi:integrase
VVEEAQERGDRRSVHLDRPGAKAADTTLQWPDLDLTGLALHVERTIGKDGTPKAPKDGERRVVDLHPMLAAAFRREAARQNAEALQDGRPWEETAYIFATRTGKPLDLANVAKAFKRVLKRAGLPFHHTLYDLRHTFATALLAEGAPLPYVAAQLGHANSATTLRYYAHWLSRGDRRYVARLRPGGLDVRTFGSLRRSRGRGACPSKHHGGVGETLSPICHR